MRMYDLPSALQRFGLKVSLDPGWEGRGAEFPRTPSVSVGHHTGGPAQGNLPSLGILRNGRGGPNPLPGPLCNVGGARDGTQVVVASGRANHAGAGGWKGYSGNSSTLGYEPESTGGGDWTQAQRDAYPRVMAAFLWVMGRNDASFICGHKEWAPGRKPDPVGIDMNWVRSEAQKLLLAGGAAPSPTLPTPGKKGKMLSIIRDTSNGNCFITDWVTKTWIPGGKPFEVATFVVVASGGSPTPSDQPPENINWLPDNVLNQQRVYETWLRSQDVQAKVTNLFERPATGPSGTAPIDPNKLAQALAPLLGEGIARKVVEVAGGKLSSP